MASNNSFNARQTLKAGDTKYTWYDVSAAEDSGLDSVSRLPRSLKVLLENVLRHEDGDSVTPETISGFSRWLSTPESSYATAFQPARIMLHDVSGIPLMMDLAAMRDRVAQSGGDPRRINPVRPIDVIMDHSVIATHAGSADAYQQNVDAEFRNNAERYKMVKWAESAFSNMRVLPPGQGICHQINLESLARVVWSEEDAEFGLTAFPDTLVGGDSHTPMINALSVLGWGVGAIEALSAALGEPVAMPIPRVVGVRLTGALREGTTTTDLVLSLTEHLRKQRVVQAFVEFYGPGLNSLSLPERATIANMAPEYGATVGYFPVDDETLRYLELTNRSHLIPLVEAYSHSQGLWHDANADIAYSEVVDFDISSVEPSVAGPNLPQRRVALSNAQESARSAITALNSEKPDKALNQKQPDSLKDGDILIAAITSCTNTSNPDVMLAAGMLARNAQSRGLSVKPWVKTSLSPGSRVVADYLNNAGLMQPLEALGFHVIGYGCMTCCGGSGALDADVTAALEQHPVATGAILSGNRNFQGRIHPLVDLAYLASPPLVVAYAIAGNLTVDITKDSLGEDPHGEPVYLSDIWPGATDLQDMARRTIAPDLFASRYASKSRSTREWNDLEQIMSDRYTWDDNSTYLRRPPFLDTATPQHPIEDIHDAAILAMFGDNVTTDHISPGARITQGSLAGDYLAERGVSESQYSGFLQRRGDHDVMLRGTFNNPHIQNSLTPERSGGWTRHSPSGEILTILDASERYRTEQRPLVVIAGSAYGTGSSRDWAARGPHLLGVRAIVAQSFERIHRSNLVGMGVLPLEFVDGTSRDTLQLDGTERLTITGLSGLTHPNALVQIKFAREDGSTVVADALCRLDTAREIAWLQAGGVMPYLLAKLTSQHTSTDRKY